MHSRWIGWLLSVLLLCAATPGRAQDAKPDAEKAPKNFVIVTEGIVGGIVAPHVRRKILIYEQNGDYVVLVMTQSSRRAERTVKRGTLTKKAAAALFADFAKQGLWTLPVETPTGVEDVYGKDTSLTVRRGAKFWRNGGPGGCVRGRSKTRPSDKQRLKFLKLLGLVQRTAVKQATGKAGAKTFLAADRRLNEAARKLGKPRDK